MSTPIATPIDPQDHPLYHKTLWHYLKRGEPIERAVNLTINMLDVLSEYETKGYVELVFTRFRELVAQLPGAEVNEGCCDWDSVYAVYNGYEYCYSFESKQWTRSLIASEDYNPEPCEPLFSMDGPQGAHWRANKLSEQAKRWSI